MTEHSISALGPAIRRVIWGLGVTQIIGYGSTYYLLSLLADDIGRDLGLSKAATLAGLSLTLVVTALIGPRVGRWQDWAGSRTVMSIGSVITSLGLVVLAMAQGPVTYYFAWAIIAIGGPMILYAAAFTAMTQVAGKQARRTISYITFLGGLASTIAWPFTAYLLTMTEWRSITLIFAAMNLAICLPIHLMLPRTGEKHRLEGEKTDPVEPGLGPVAQKIAFYLLGAALTLKSFINNVWSLLVFALLQGLGFAPATAVFVGSLVGIFQVGGRMGELAFGARHSPIWTGLFAGACMPLAFLALSVSGGNLIAGIAFAALYGISNGLITIARATLVLSIFGSLGYGERLSRISIASNTAGASAPVLGGFLMDRLGASSLVMLMLSAAFLAFALMIGLWRHCRKNGLR